MFFFFFHNISLLGLLFSRPWVCRGWLLESSFSDHPPAPGTLLLLLLCYTLILNLLVGSYSYFPLGPFFSPGTQLLLHNDILCKPTLGNVEGLGLHRWAGSHRWPGSHRWIWHDFMQCFVVKISFIYQKYTLEPASGMKSLI